MTPELPRPTLPKRSTILLIAGIFLLIAGAAIIVRDYYQDIQGLSNATPPSAALLKATLLNGAVDMGYGYETNTSAPYGGRNAQGWGMANLEQSLTPLAPRSFFSAAACDAPASTILSEPPPGSTHAVRVSLANVRTRPAFLRRAARMTPTRSLSSFSIEWSVLDWQITRTATPGFVSQNHTSRASSTLVIFTWRGLRITSRGVRCEQ